MWLWWKKVSYISIAVLLLFAILYAFIPIVVEAFWGGSIIDEHISTVIGTTTNADDTAYRLLQWEEINFDDPYSSWENKWYNRYGVYRINGSYTWFIRSNQLSWLIKSKLGNCEERAYYFVQMMNRTGHPARIVCVIEDHCWAEYHSDGFWVAVDPSLGIHINPISFAAGKNWSHMEARYLNGSTEDVTYRYLNTVPLFIRADNEGGTVKIYSTALSSGGSEMYKNPAFITSERLESPLILQFGPLPSYEIKYEKAHGPISFHTKYAPVTLPSNITISRNELVQWRNARPNVWAFVILGILYLILLVLNAKHKSTEFDR